MSEELNVSGHELRRAEQAGIAPTAKGHERLAQAGQALGGQHCVNDYQNQASAAYNQGHKAQTLEMPGAIPQQPPSWTPPLVEDDCTGKRRVATQADVDHLQAAADAYAALREKMRAALSIR